MSTYDTLWDEEFYEALREGAEADAASEWLELFDRLEEIGVVDRHDRDITLRELQRLASYLVPTPLDGF